MGWGGSATPPATGSLSFGGKALYSSCLFSWDPLRHKREPWLVCFNGTPYDIKGSPGCLFERLRKGDTQCGSQGTWQQLDRGEHGIMSPGHTCLPNDKNTRSRARSALYPCLPNDKNTRSRARSALYPCLPNDKNTRSRARSALYPCLPNDKNTRSRARSALYPCLPNDKNTRSRARSAPYAAARHAHDEMSPVIRLKKSAMTEGQLATLKEASAMKKPAAIERCRDMLVVGGDNSCESEVSRVKSQMRRQNQMGRVSPMQAHIVQLAGRMLLQRPGLSTVLEAFKTYRMARQNCMGCPPDSFLVLSKDSAWLLRS